MVKGILMKIFLLCLLAVSPAFSECGQFTMCNSPMDYYVPGNLMELSAKAEANRMARFWKKLGCENRSDSKYGRVACNINGTEIVWEDERQTWYPFAVVPGDGALHTPQPGKLF